MRPVCGAQERGDAADPWRVGLNDAAVVGVEERHVLRHRREHLTGRDWGVEDAAEVGVSDSVPCVQRLLDPDRWYASSSRHIRRARARSHCWLASTISGVSPRCTRIAATRSRSIFQSGCPTLILMPPIPDSNEAVAFSLISSTDACRKPPEVL